MQTPIALEPQSISNPDRAGWRVDIISSGGGVIFDAASRGRVFAVFDFATLGLWSVRQLKIWSKQLRNRLL